MRILKSEMASKSGLTEPDTLLALLQAAGAEAEDESEKIADDYLSKNIDDVDEFLQKFMVRL